jgi:hypothetical protein
MKTLEERRDLTLLEHPLFLLQVNNTEYAGCNDCGAEAEFAHWKVDRVFLDDGEARDYARYHRLGRENYEWRVWAVPADGELRNRLA